MGFLLGALVTIVIQSSSATTVMVMGFINAEIMDLAQATGVIFGANIGTTITSILIALDVSGIAPICICIGAVMLLYAKKKRNRYIGQVVLGFGILFQGLHTIEPGDVTAEGLTGISGIHSECEKSAAWLCSRSHPLCCDSELFGCCRCLAGFGHAGTDALVFCGVCSLWYQCRVFDTAAAFRTECKEQCEACRLHLSDFQHCGCNFIYSAIDPVPDHTDD